MKACNLSHWSNLEKKANLLFFAQALEEMLFHHGHDSLKVPALNFHFLCYEISATIANIEKGIIYQGNLKPLMKEFFEMYNSDPIVCKIFGNNAYDLFCGKNKNGEYSKPNAKCLETLNGDFSIKNIKNVIGYLITDLNLNNKYYNMLIKRIEQLVKSGTTKYGDADELYKLTKAWVTDLINRRYSQEHIYHIINEIFFTRYHRVNDIEETLKALWDTFDFMEKEYAVYLPVKEASQKKVLNSFKGIKIENNSDERFGNSCEKVIYAETKALDPERARRHIVSIIEFYFSLVQYQSHIENKLVDLSAEVIDKSNKVTIKLKPPVSPIERGKNRDSVEIIDKAKVMIQHLFGYEDKIIDAVTLHSSAINTNGITNQILNLWTIIEVLIECDNNKGIDKVIQICNVLCSVLNQKYIYSLFEQLLEDLKRCAPSDLDAILSSIDCGEDNKEKLLAIIVLRENEQTYIRLKEALPNYPVLRYRIELYKKIFSSRSGIKSVLRKHSRRLSWQIMRIYRNRNLIIHSNEFLPYLEVVLQNLHYYIDTLIDTLIDYHGFGYRQINDVFSAIMHKERLYFLLLDKKDASGKKDLGITQDDFISVIFN